MLTWNLFHGRSVPGAGRDLFDDFAAALASWRWDVAALQEVPPWWASGLARACNAECATALTSRNALLSARRLLARHWPDAMKSNGGGANAILSRCGLAGARTARLRVWPERRVAQLARVDRAGGVWVANYHASTRPPLARAELARLWSLGREAAAGAPLVVAGDLNLRDPAGPLGAMHVAARDVDHVYALRARGGAQLPRPDHGLRGGAGLLSDHPPLVAAVELGGEV